MDVYDTGTYLIGKKSGDVIEAKTGGNIASNNHHGFIFKRISPLLLLLTCVLFLTACASGKSDKSNPVTDITEDAPVFTASAYSFAAISIDLEGKVLGRVEATISANNSIQAAPNYTYAADNGTANDIFTLNPTTGDIALKRSLVTADIGDYIFAVIAKQRGNSAEGSANVTVKILDIEGDEDMDGFMNAYDVAPINRTVHVSGTGIPGDPYIISNIYQLQAIDGVDHNQRHLDRTSSATNGQWLYGANRTAQLQSSYQLSNYINANVTRDWNGGEGFNPIGDCGGNPCYATPDNPFSGVLNGAGFMVDNLFINRIEDGTTKGNIGLFALTGNATIMNLGLENLNIIVSVLTGELTTGIGGLIGGTRQKLRQLAANLNHVYVTGAIRAIDKSPNSNNSIYVGGLIGEAIINIDIKNSYTIVNLIGGSHQGGLLGVNLAGYINVFKSYSFNRISETRKEGGGLLGADLHRFSPTASYTVSYADTSDDVFSLVGLKNTGRPVDSNTSYWQSEMEGGMVKGVVRSLDVTASKGLSVTQLQNCELDGVMIDGTSAGVCTGLFPEGTDADPLWGDQTENGVTTGWDFLPVGEYPYLFANDDEGRDLLPTVAEQRCQRNKFFYNLPCAEGL